MQLFSQYLTFYSTFNYFIQYSTFYFLFDNPLLLTTYEPRVRENLKPRPCHIERAIARSIQQGPGLRFSRKD